MSLGSLLLTGIMLSLFILSWPKQAVWLSLTMEKERILLSQKDAASHRAIGIFLQAEE